MEEEYHWEPVANEDDDDQFEVFPEKEENPYTEYLKLWYNREK